MDSEDKGALIFLGLMLIGVAISIFSIGYESYSRRKTCYDLVINTRTISPEQSTYLYNKCLQGE